MRNFLIVATVVAACQPSAPSAVTPTPIAHTVAPPAAGSAIGFRSFEVADPISHVAMPAAVFYPATGPSEAHTNIGPYTLAAGADLPIREGRLPLVAISHGHGGSMWGHHDLAEALARHGYVVAVVEHAGDNYHDQSDFRSDRVLFGRAYQISATIDAILADPSLGPHVDPARIGVTGFSAGGSTSLLLVGAHPDFSLITAYCVRRPDDGEICGGPVRLELESPTPTVDHRIKAAFAMAPYAIPFGAGGFEDVRSPIFLYWGTADRLLVPRDNADLVARAPTLHGKRSIEGAGHYIFLSPCAAALAAKLPELCMDAPGLDRARIHEQIARDAIAFFDAALR